MNGGFSQARAVLFSSRDLPGLISAAISNASAEQSKRRLQRECHLDSLISKQCAKAGHGL